jgi:hypothetical protein
VSAADVIGRSPDVREVAEAVADVAADRWGGAWERDTVSGELLAEAACHEMRFRSPEWTWRA